MLSKDSLNFGVKIFYIADIARAPDPERRMSLFLHVLLLELCLGLTLWTRRKAMGAIKENERCMKSVSWAEDQRDFSEKENDIDMELG